MADLLEALKGELEHFGAAYDATHERAGRMFNITRHTGQFLAVLVRATGARKILEIGTSNGYSTLWLAELKNPSKADRIAASCRPADVTAGCPESRTTSDASRSRRISTLPTVVPAWLRKRATGSMAMGRACDARGSR